MRGLTGELCLSPLPCRPASTLQRISAPAASDPAIARLRVPCAGLAGPLVKAHSCARQRHPDLAARAAAHDVYPFDERDYYKVRLQVVAAGVSNHAGGPTVTGNVVLIRSDEHETPTPDSQVLLLSISGDAVLGLTRLMNHGAHHKERPLSMDLLWSVLQRQVQVEPSNRLLRVAVVDIQSFAYIGRLFFGDPATGEHSWDCDCRPSDACWLALRSRCSIYVKKHVWDDNAQALKALSHGAAVHSHAQPAMEELSGIAAATTIRSDDPEPLKLLKRKMAVAIGEEDYAQAACIRDHPYMALHLESLRLRSAGRPQEADRVRQQMSALIDADGARPVTKGATQQQV